MSNEVNDTAEEKELTETVEETAQTETAESAAPEEEKEEKVDKKTYIIREIISWVETIVFAIIFAFLITTFIIVNAKVPSASMENTVMTGDRLIANRLSYKFGGEPQRYDIVVFKYPDDESKLFIKRIIGLPGETIDIRGGLVYIDGSDEPLRTDFQHEDMIMPVDGSGNEIELHYTVPEGHYFMMGDNRNHSLDSRAWENKFVAEDKILGKAVFRYSPIKTAGIIK